MHVGLVVAADEGLQAEADLVRGFGVIELTSPEHAVTALEIYRIRRRCAYVLVNGFAVDQYGGRTGFDVYAFVEMGIVVEHQAGKRAGGSVGPESGADAQMRKQQVPGETLVGRSDGTAFGERDDEYLFNAPEEGVVGVGVGLGDGIRHLGNGLDSGTHRQGEGHLDISSVKYNAFRPTAHLICSTSGKNGGPQ